MSYNFDLHHSVFVPVGNFRVACTDCGGLPPDDGVTPSDDGGLPTLKPNVAIIIIGLGFTLILVAAFAVFAKFMRPHLGRHDFSGASRLWADFVKDGNSIDAKLITTLPLVVFSAESFLGLNLHSECAVCLSQFLDNEELRLLPNCKHMFHPSCIDSWLQSHPSCPMCRGTIFSPPWIGDPPVSGVVNAASTQPLNNTQQQRVEEFSSHHHVEITVDSTEARFETLRNTCCGRKSNILPTPDARCPSPQKESMNAIELGVGQSDSSAEVVRPAGEVESSSDQSGGTVCIVVAEARSDVVSKKNLPELRSLDRGKD